MSLLEPSFVVAIGDGFDGNRGYVYVLDCVRRGGESGLETSCDKSFCELEEGVDMALGRVGDNNDVAVLVVHLLSFH